MAQSTSRSRHHFPLNTMIFEESTAPPPIPAFNPTRPHLHSEPPDDAITALPVPNFSRPAPRPPTPGRHGHVKSKKTSKSSFLKRIIKKLKNALQRKKKETKTKPDPKQLPAPPLPSLKSQISGPINFKHVSSGGSAMSRHNPTESMPSPGSIVVNRHTQVESVPMPGTRAVSRHNQTESMMSLNNSMETQVKRRPPTWYVEETGVRASVDGWEDMPPSRGRY